ncbi:MAG: saccharopine dehydrogenase NADP-binding domain-containing protein, partial [Ignavibacteria bacterium]|nr:saccharopine dehydrogenase NADP-binding domain-containing protein [Ignavibacteria bacterium]
MKYLVLGSGMMGSAVAYDLAKRNPQDEVQLGDINIAHAKTTAQAIGENVRPMRVDVNNTRELVGAMTGNNVVISAVSYSVNHQITRAALQ